LLQEGFLNSHFTDESLSWRKLCRAAAFEEDPDKLSQIVERMNFALKTRQGALRILAQSTRGITLHISSKVKRLA
jgi:hypothetical protein